MEILGKRKQSIGETGDKCSVPKRRLGERIDTANQQDLVLPWE
jgi:hypothetical protein